MTGGGGADRFVQGPASSRSSTENAQVDNVTTIVTFGNGVDRITDFNSAELDVLNAADLTDVNIRTSGDLGDGGGGGAIENGNVLLFQGSFNVGTGEFTFSATGADLLYGAVSIGAGPGEDPRVTGFGNTSIVLQGGAAGFNALNNFIALQD